MYIDYDGNIWIGNCASSLVDRFNYEGYKKAVKEFKNYTEEGKKKFDKEFYMSGKAVKKIISLDEADKYWGYLGNINEGMIENSYYTICEMNSCGCGADVILSKCKNKDDAKKLLVTLNGYKESGKQEKFTKNLDGEQVAVEMNFPIPYQILWDLGRRCNYDCFYCWPSVHNNKEEWVDYDVVIKTIDMMIDKWSNGNEIRWNFGGGEPTMHPQFLDILKYLKNRNQWILVTTNGSRSSSFWKEARQYINSINMSAHFYSMDMFPGNEERFIENCKIIMEHHNIHDSDYWIEIKLMTPPGYLEKALTFKKKINDLDLLNRPGANGRMKGVMSLVPIRSIDDSSEMVNYSPNELEYFKNQ